MQKFIIRNFPHLKICSRYQISKSAQNCCRGLEIYLVKKKNVELVKFKKKIKIFLLSDFGILRGF